jgi:hypothetical protein
MCRSLQLQFVKFSLKINVLCQLFGYALFLGSELLVATHDCFQFLVFFCECLITSCIRGRIKTSNSTTYTGRRVIMSYQGKIVQLFGDLLEDLMLSSVRIGSSTRSVVMMFWYLCPATSKSPGLLEVPAASSEDGCWAPASQDAFST